MSHISFPHSHSNFATYESAVHMPCTARRRHRFPLHFSFPSPSHWDFSLFPPQTIAKNPFTKPILRCQEDTPLFTQHPSIRFRVPISLRLQARRCRVRRRTRTPHCEANFPLISSPSKGIRPYLHNCPSSSAFTFRLALQHFAIANENITDNKITLLFPIILASLDLEPRFYLLNCRRSFVVTIFQAKLLIYPFYFIL